MLNELTEAVAVLDKMVETMKRRGQDFAKAKSDYEIAKAQRILKYRDEGQPATLTIDLVKGSPDVAKLRLTKDIAETLYRTVQEAIQTQKLKIRIMESQIQREWGNTR